MKVVYKITYPNGKIYIGKDLTGSANYFGSASSELIGAEFTTDELRDFTIRREVLWESETATDREVNDKEVELIRHHRSNDPSVGYNRWPRFRPPGPPDGRYRHPSGEKMDYGYFTGWVHPDVLKARRNRHPRE